MDYLVLVEKIPGAECIVYKEHEMLCGYYKGMRDMEKT